MSRIVQASLIVTAIALLSQIDVHSAPQKKVTPPGKLALEKQGCNHCHIVGGKGGTVAPPLDGLTKFRSKEQIIKRLTSAQPSSSLATIIPPSLMDHVRIPKREAEEIADYISTLTKTGSVAYHKTGKGPVPKDSVPQGAQFKPAPATTATKEGARIYWEKGCIACHSIGPVGGELGPNLAGIGARRSKSFIEHRILSGAMLLPRPGEASSYAMPPQTVSPAQAKKLTQFLLTLPKEASLYQP